MNPNNNKRLFLLDAMALVYRAYYALIRNPRLTSKGRNTNAQFGFTNSRSASPRLPPLQSKVYH